MRLTWPVPLSRISGDEVRMRYFRTSSYRKINICHTGDGQKHAREGTVGADRGGGRLRADDGVEFTLTSDVSLCGRVDVYTYTSIYTL